MRSHCFLKSVKSLYMFNQPFIKRGNLRKDITHVHLNKSAILASRVQDGGSVVEKRDMLPESTASLLKP